MIITRNSISVISDHLVAGTTCNKQYHANKSYGKYVSIVDDTGKVVYVSATVQRKFFIVEGG